MADDTRTRVLHAAGAIFAEKGFEATTVREICAAAGVNLASVNYHFGDKQALYLETVTLAHRLRLKQIPPAEWPEDTPPRERLSRFIHTMLSRMLGRKELAWQTRLMMREMLEPTGACKSLVEEFIRPQLRQLLEILDDILPEETDDCRRHQIAFSIVGQCLHYRVAHEFVALLVPKKEWQTHYGIEQLAEHITTFSMSALKEYARQAPQPDKREQRPATKRRKPAAAKR